MSATDQELDRERDHDAAESDSESTSDPDSDADTSPSASTSSSPSSSSISDLPPSAKLVYKVLEYEGAMTQEEIAAESRLCARTVRYALGKLEDADCVASRVCLEDARQSKYRIAD